MTREELFQIQKEKIRKRLLKYTRKAFRMLPRLDHPYILDIGCGSGIPTIELARLSQGEVLGIDIDQSALDKFATKIEEEGFEGRVKAINRSLIGMEFSDRSYDIIWSEGSIYAVGFERGLKEWRKLLKPDGFIVIHDEQGDVEEKLRQISSCGYELLGHFLLSEETWRDEYFTPLEELISKTRKGCADNPKIIEELHQAQMELDIFNKNPERNSSAYFIAKKK